MTVGEPSFPMAPPSSQWTEGYDPILHRCNFAEFQFGVLAALAGLTTSHCLDDVLAVNRNTFLALACLACLSSLLW